MIEGESIFFNSFPIDIQSIVIVFVVVAQVKLSFVSRSIVAKSDGMMLIQLPLLFPSLFLWHFNLFFECHVCFGEKERPARVEWLACLSFHFSCTSCFLPPSSAPSSLPFLPSTSCCPASCLRIRSLPSFCRSCFRFSLEFSRSSNHLLLLHLRFPESPCCCCCCPVSSPLLLPVMISSLPSLFLWMSLLVFHSSTSSWRRIREEWKRKVTTLKARSSSVIPSGSGLFSLSTVLGNKSLPFLRSVQTVLLFAFFFLFRSFYFSSLHFFFFLSCSSSSFSYCFSFFFLLTFASLSFLLQMPEDSLYWKRTKTRGEDEERKMRSFTWTGRKKKSLSLFERILVSGSVTVLSLLLILLLILIPRSSLYFLRVLFFCLPLPSLPLLVSNFNFSRQSCFPCPASSVPLLFFGLRSITSDSPPTTRRDSGYSLSCWCEHSFSHSISS